MSGQECSTSGREYLAYFMHRHLDFRLAEVDALMEGLGMPPTPSRWRQPYGGQQYSPFWYLTLPSDEAARRLTHRSILLKAFPISVAIALLASYGCVPVQSIPRASARPACAQGLMEVWGEGDTVEELQEAIESFPPERMAPWLTADRSLKVWRTLPAACKSGVHQAPKQAHALAWSTGW